MNFMDYGEKKRKQHERTFHLTELHVHVYQELYTILNLPLNLVKQVTRNYGTLLGMAKETNYKTDLYILVTIF